MKNEDELYIEVEKYLHQKMEATELEAFEKQLNENPEIQQKVQVQRLAQEYIVKNRLSQLSNYSKELQHKEVKQQQYARFAKIGVGVLIAGLSAYLFIKPTEPSLAPSQKTDSVYTPKNEKTAPSVTPIIPQNTGKDINQATSKVVQKPINSSTEKISEQTAVPLPIEEQTKKPLEPIVARSEALVEKSVTIQNKEIYGPCHQVILKAHIESFKTCAGESEGAISVSQIQGGHKPYQIKLISAADHQEKGLSNLEAGNYVVSITDSKNCSQVFDNIIVSTKPCNVDTHFNPVLGEVWEVPSSSLAADLHIHDQSGRLVFQQHISAMDRASWDGKNLDGRLQSGIFVYLLKYADGTQRQGNITVLQ